MSQTLWNSLFCGQDFFSLEISFSGHSIMKDWQRESFVGAARCRDSLENIFCTAIITGNFILISPFHIQGHFFVLTKISSLT